jgi:prepilin-type N-terminal cleavage/methylation domain-containing protein
MGRASGFTVPELLIVIALMGIGLTAAVMNLAPAEAPLSTAATVLESTFRQARLQAISTTSAHRVSPTGSGGLNIEFASTCSDTTWNPAPHGNYELPDGVSMSDTSWVICFSSRGLSSVNQTIVLNHPDYGSISVEVLVGGTTRVL